MVYHYIYIYILVPSFLTVLTETPLGYDNTQVMHKIQKIIR